MKESIAVSKRCPDVILSSTHGRSYGGTIPPGGAYAKDNVEINGSLVTSGHGVRQGCLPCSAYAKDHGEIDSRPVAAGHGRHYDPARLCMRQMKSGRDD